MHASYLLPISHQSLIAKVRVDHFTDAAGTLGVIDSIWRRMILMLNASCQGQVFTLEITQYESYVRFVCSEGSKAKKSNPRHKEIFYRFRPPCE